jgi:hypothetical protein
MEPFEDKKKDKDDDSEEDNDKTLFVFYTLLKSECWTYKDIPDTWWWVGSGSTMPCYSNPPYKPKPNQYEREEQFSGSDENFQEMQTYLTKIFQHLKDNNVISGFEIADHYIYH